MKTIISFFVALLFASTSWAGSTEIAALTCAPTDNPTSEIINVYASEKNMMYLVYPAPMDPDTLPISIENAISIGNQHGKILSGFNLTLAKDGSKVASITRKSGTDKHEIEETLSFNIVSVSGGENNLPSLHIEVTRTNRDLTKENQTGSNEITPTRYDCTSPFTSPAEELPATEGKGIFSTFLASIRPEDGVLTHTHSCTAVDGEESPGDGPDALLMYINQEAKDLLVNHPKESTLLTNSLAFAVLDDEVNILMSGLDLSIGENGLELAKGEFTVGNKVLGMKMEWDSEDTGKATLTLSTEKKDEPGSREYKCEEVNKEKK